MQTDRLVVAVSMLLAAGIAMAQTYPTRPITLVVTTSAGTTPDVLARHLSPLLSQRLGQPVIVDNRPGASGNIGAAQVAKAAPDGHTLMMTALLFSMTPAFNKDLPFDPDTDFAPIGTLAKATLALVAHPSNPATSAREYVALARSRPGHANFGTPGIGTPHHLILELLKRQEKVDIVHVPYKGTAGMVAGLLGGEIGAAFFPLVGAMAPAKGGKLKILAILAEKRIELAPNVPTFREENIDDMDIDQWMAVFAPAKTPREIINRVNQELMATMESPIVKDFNRSQGILPMPGTPDELGVLMKRELARWKKVVAEAGIKAE
ncbi:MAG: Bug family tripartite tricarboxylate transporter substrate binding protein [Burkholderiales bacterium]